jgi:UDP-3-O-[3-hydroxymyristoyl] glucosamine N-acyltransferase
MELQGRKDVLGMSLTVQELAELVHGRISGDPNLRITAARPLGDAGEGHITFLENIRYLNDLATNPASAFVAPESMPSRGRTVIHAADPLGAFVAIFRKFQGLEEEKPAGVDARTFVHPTATIGPRATIDAFAVVGEGSVVGARCRLHSGVVIGRGCKVGDDVTLYPHVVLYDGTILGHRVIVHANAVLGADGFGYRFQGGRHVKVPQLGCVEISDDVEIGAGTAIDRGTFQATRIGRGTKIDNLVQIGHNCRIGDHNLIVSQVGVAGSCSTDSYVVLAGQVGVADHVHIGEGAVVGAQAGVWKDVVPGVRVLGAPATSEREHKRVIICLEKLPELVRDVRRIKQQLGITDEGAAA